MAIQRNKAIVNKNKSIGNKSLIKIIIKKNNREKQMLKRYT